MPRGISAVKIDAEKLRAACIKSGFSQVEIAEIIGMDKTYVQHALNRKRMDAEKLKAVCTLLRVDWSAFLAADEGNEPEQPEQKPDNMGELLTTLGRIDAKLSEILLETQKGNSQIRKFIETWES